jgi:hypothetical protein
VQIASLIARVQIASLIARVQIASLIARVQIVSRFHVQCSSQPVARKPAHAERLSADCQPDRGTKQPSSQPFLQAHSHPCERPLVQIASLIAKPSDLCSLSATGRTHLNLIGALPGPECTLSAV